MANGAFKFKDNSGNVVSFISGSGSDILISGGTLNLSGMTGLTLGNLTMSGTTQNAVSTSHAASYLLTSSFNSYTGTTNTIIGSLQTSTGSLNTFTSSTDGRLNSIETSTGSLNSYTSSTNTRLGVIESTTSSLNTFTSSANGRLNSIEGKTGSYATTGSNTFNGNLTVTGYIDTQELRTTYISSSILYRSGSTKFGDESTDTHAFTGSLLVSGSSNPLQVTGIISSVASGTDGGQIRVANSGGGSNWYWAARTTGLNLGELGSADGRIFVANGGNVGINKSTSLNATLDVNGNTIVSGSLTATGNANSSPSIIANNSAGASGTSQYYIDFTAGATTIGRIFRGNGASGVVGNGLNIDNFDGFQVRLNQLGGSGGSFNIMGGNVAIGNTSASRMLSLGSSTGAHGYIALYGPSINEGNIYHTSTYGIYMDTNTNLLPIRIDGSKLVIGVTGDVIAGSTGTPEGKIDIKGGALVVDVSNNGYGGFKLDDDSGGDYNVNFRAGRGGPNDGFRWYLNARPSGGGAFSTGNERMRLTNTGLGVGIDNPLGKLHIRSSGITAAAPSNGWPVYNAEADTNARRIYIDTGGNDNVATAGYGATAAIELCGYFDSRAVITTQSAGSQSPSDQGQGRGKDLMIKAGTSDNTNGYKGGRLYLNGGIGYQGGFGANGGDILMQVLSGSGNVGINQTQPQTKLDVNGNIKNGGRVYSGNSVIGNIATNLNPANTRSYILVCDLNDIAGFSLNGFMNAASYTCWNMSSFYIMKNYSSTSANAGITGQYKAGGCDMNIVDLSYGGGRYIAIGYTSNPEIDVVWTGYRLLHMLNSDGSAQVIPQSSVTVNSTLASY